MNGPSGSAGTAGDGYRIAWDDDPQPVIPRPRECDDPAEPGARRPARVPERTRR